MDDSIKRGRLIIRVSIGMVLAFSAYVILTYLSQMKAPIDSPAGTAAIATRAVHFLLTVLLMLMLYRGSIIAKWICIVLFSIAIAMTLPLVLKLPMTLGLVGVYGGFLATLLLSFDVGAFLKNQRE